MSEITKEQMLALYHKMVRAYTQTTEWTKAESEAEEAISARLTAYDTLKAEVEQLRAEIYVEVVARKKAEAELAAARLVAALPDAPKG